MRATMALPEAPYLVLPFGDCRGWIGSLANQTVTATPKLFSLDPYSLDLAPIWARIFPAPSQKPGDTDSGGPGRSTTQIVIVTPLSLLSLAVARAGEMALALERSRL